MAKLDGYYAVAEIEEGCYGMKYFYAIYDDGEIYKTGDKVLVSGANRDILIEIFLLSQIFLRQMNVVFVPQPKLSVR